MLIEKRRSVQDYWKGPGVVPFDLGQAGAFLWQVATQLTTAPTYWSKQRDDWLVDFWKKPGNDILAGAIATVVAKIQTASWYVEGPQSIATFYRDLLLHRSDFGRGWSTFINKWVQSCIARDFGGWCERFRSSASDLEGPALGFAHLDESKCYPNPDNDPEYPVVYQKDHNSKFVKLHRSQVMGIVDMPESRDSKQGVGFCAVSRALATAAILMDIVKYKREKLSDLPMAGILLLNNIDQIEWEDLVKKYDARQHNEGNSVWRDVMTMCGVDPAFPITAELISFSEVYEQFKERDAVEIAVYTFALAFREDPREFWPVSSGALGTSTETKIQHLKAKAKGEGIFFKDIERQLNSPDSLPRGCRFGFDYRDDEEDEAQAKIRGMKINNIRNMWLPVPGSQAFHGPSQPGMEREGELNRFESEGQEDDQGGRRSWLQRAFLERRAFDRRQIEEDERNNRFQRDEEMQDEEARQADENQLKGLITTEEARWLLAYENIVPPELIGVQLEAISLYDTKHYGPRVRAYAYGGVPGPVVRVMRP